MKKISILAAILISFCIAAKAQGSYEAFMFSQSEYLGTARFMGAGGAFGATGGEFSALSTNPAAIGLYKRHEVTFTPMNLTFSTTNTSYYDNESSIRPVKYTVPQCGIVLAKSINRENNWRAWQFGFGYNRIMDFNNKFRGSAINNQTMMDMVVSSVNGTNFQNLSGDGYLAWNSWLIDTIPGTTDQYYSTFDGNSINQTFLVKRSGSIDEMTFSFGGNYNDKLFLGATVGFPFIDYQETVSITENPANTNHINGISQYEWYSKQKNSGTGVNLKLGVIYQPVDFLRLGIGFHTPTYFWRIKDNFTREMQTDYSNSNHNTDSYSNYNSFTLTTPLKFNASASFLIMKRAFIAAEYEFQNYRGASLSADNYDYIFENQEIADKYGVSHSLRVGGEVNLTQSFAIRAGYRIKTSPFKENVGEFDNAVHYASAGIGFRGQHFLADISYVFRFSKDAYWLYNPIGTPCLNTNTSHGIVATLGFKF